MGTTQKIFFLIALTHIISACGPVKTQYAEWVYADPDRGNDTSQPDPTDDRYLYELADRFGLMALFANVVYRDDLLEKEKQFDANDVLVSEILLSDKKLDSACDYLSPSVPLPPYGMPYTTSPDTVESSGYWSRWRGSAEIESVPCLYQDGLFYETYVYNSDQGIREAVIAFRGTENSRSQIWSDWKANLASAFGFEPGQYKIASKTIPDVIQALKSETPDIKIYAVGHSLGGGLAQQAGYLSKDVKEVFTFNTSPVTNWTNLALQGKVDNAYPIIHRIYNGGEALGGIRSVSTLFTNARYGRHDIGVQVKSKQLLAGHSMTLLSCHLACLVESEGKTAKHEFSSGYIRNELMVKKGICSGYTELEMCDLTLSSQQ